MPPLPDAPTCFELLARMALIRRFEEEAGRQYQRAKAGGFLHLAIAEEVTLLWQTDEVRHDRLRISDEIRNGLWYFEHSLFDAAEDLLREWRQRFPDAPPPLRFGSWIGGDMDGNPSAGVTTIGEARSRAHTLAREHYRDYVRALAVELSPHRSFVDVTD